MSIESILLKVFEHNIEYDIDISIGRDSDYFSALTLGHDLRINEFRPASREQTGKPVDERTRLRDKHRYFARIRASNGWNMNATIASDYIVAEEVKPIDTHCKLAIFKCIGQTFTLLELTDQLRPTERIARLECNFYWKVPNEQLVVVTRPRDLRYTVLYT